MVLHGCQLCHPYASVSGQLNAASHLPTPQFTGFILLPFPSATYTLSLASNDGARLVRTDSGSVLVSNTATGATLTETSATLVSTTGGWVPIRWAHAMPAFKRMLPGSSNASMVRPPQLTYVTVRSHSAVPAVLFCRLDFWQGTGVGGVQLSWSATGLRIGGSTGSLADRQIVPSSNLYSLT